MRKAWALYVFSFAIFFLSYNGNDVNGYLGKEMIIIG